MYCQNCGQDLEGNEKICPNCGSPLTLGTVTPVDDHKSPRQPQGELPPVANASAPPGWRPPESTKPRDWKNDLWIGFVAFLFVFIGVPSCLGGGCMLLIQFGAHDYGGRTWLSYLIPIGLIGISGALLYLLIKVNRGDSKR